MTVPEKQQATRSRIRVAAARIAALYRGCALLFLNTLMAYLLLNLVLGGVFLIRDAFRSERRAGEAGDGCACG